jgi:glycosyltransferase involved in cell wall biosynthesis
LDRVIRDWNKLLAIHPRAKLLIVGAGEDQTRLENMKAENVIFTGMQPYSSLPEFIRSSDVCINPFELNPITEKILPTKLFQYLGCGRPVVATKLPGTMPFLAGEEDGVVYTRTEDTVDALIQLLSDRDRRIKLGERGIAAARRYDWTQIARQMVAWFKELAKD